MSLTPEQLAEIAAQRATTQPTLRATAPGMEAHLYTAHPVLDHGLVRVIDYMGDDAAICQAARVSYGRGTKAVSDDRGLIRYLMRHWHSTPFEMCEVKFHVKLPVFVARQWIRHRTANVNEYSARYSILDREFYIPEPSQLAAQSTVNNQGRGEVLSGPEAARVLEIRSRHLAEAVEIAVVDCGRGLPEADMTRLFTAFFTTREHGMGMGLSICRSIVESHGGRIRAERNAGMPGATRSRIEAG